MLTPRLETVLSKITGRTVADIGTDHAYIPIELIKKSLADSAIACDINQGPLAIAQANVEKNSLADKIELRLGSGIGPIAEGEVESVVIAGMGGILIRDILQNDIDKAHSYKELILQPMNAQAELREYLAESGFCITDEDLAVEGFKVYNILRVCTGNMWKISEIELHIPSALKNNKHYDALFAKKKREFERILNGLERAAERDDAMIKHYGRLLNELNKR